MNIRALCCVAVFLAALPLSSHGVEPSRSRSIGRQDALKPGALSSEVNRALRDAFPSTTHGRRDQAKNLLSLYTQTGAAKEISATQRARLQASLKSRLARLSTAIARDSSQAPGDSQSPPGQSPPGQSPPGQSPPGQSSSGTNATNEPQSLPAGGAGGAPQNDGQALVELIQATIAPQSWEVNGGQGTIVYWPAWQVLVVRQTDDVHEQIGGVVHAMRK